MVGILTVTTAAESQALVDLATVKQELKITDASQDAQLQRWIDEASAQIANACDRVFVSEVVSERFRLPSAASGVRLARVPTTAIASVTIDGEEQDASAYEVDANGFLYRLDDDARVYWDASTVEIAYTGGYTADLVPSPLRRACIMLVRGLSSTGARDPYIKAETVDGVGRFDYWIGPTSVDRATGLPVEVAALVRPYVRITV